MSTASLFQITPETNGGSEIEDAATEAFEALEASGLLGPIEKVKRATILKAARTLDAGLSSGKVSVATSNVLKQVLEALDSLPLTATGDEGMDALARTLEALTDKALADGMGADRGR